MNVKLIIFLKYNILLQNIVTIFFKVLELLKILLYDKFAALIK
jgi:hypothetical protein